MTAGASLADGGPGWRQLADMEESYASVLQELMVEHSGALEELQQVQYKEMTAQLGAEGDAQQLTTAARRRRAAATEALVHTHVTQLQEQRAQQEEERRELQAAQRANYRSLAVSISEEEAEAKPLSAVSPRAANEEVAAVESRGESSWLPGRAMAMLASYGASFGRGSHTAPASAAGADGAEEQEDSDAEQRASRTASPSSSAAADHESAGSVNSDDLLTSGAPQLDFPGLSLSHSLSLSLSLSL